MQIRESIERAQSDALEAVTLTNEARSIVAELMEQAETAGRRQTAARLRELLSVVIAAGIRAETGTGHTQNAVEWLGGEVEESPLLFSQYIARPGGLV